MPTSPSSMMYMLVISLPAKLRMSPRLRVIGSAQNATFGIRFWVMIYFKASFSSEIFFGKFLLKIDPSISSKLARFKLKKEHGVIAITVALLVN